MTSGQLRRRVVVVEDEGMIAMLLEDMLADLGHEVVATVGTLTKAAAIVADAAFDFAILDVNINGENTYSLAERLKARGISFLFATGYGGAGLRKDWKDAPVLQKPFQMNELDRLMQQLLPTTGAGD